MTPSNDVESHDEERAVAVKAKRLSLIWLVPLIALIVTGLLLYQNTFDKGPQIEVTISSAENIEAGKTLVKFRSVTVGRVESVRLDENYTQAVLTINMEPGTEPLLSEDSRFWLVRPRIENTGVSGLDTLLSGAYLQIDKGESTTMSRSFKALDDVPPVISGVQGVTIDLYSRAAKRLSTGDAVTFKGFTVGRVVNATLNLENDLVDYQIFIEKPFDSILNANTRFWIASGVSFSLSAEGLDMSTDSLDNILRAGMSFGNFGDDTEAPFNFAEPQELFGSQNEAKSDSLGAGLKYVVFMNKDLKSIRQGSGVFFNSVRIGEVIAAPWFASMEELFTSDELPVLISLNINEGERDFVAMLIENNAHRGSLCAHISAANLISGDNRVNLSFSDVEGQCPIKNYRGLIALTAESSASIDDRLSAISENIQQLDLGGISDDLRQALQSFSGAMQAFTNSNDELKRLQLLPKMTASFEKFSTMLQSYSEGSELYLKLNNAVEDVRALLEDISPAMVQLGQDPSSVIFGSSRTDVVPKKKQEN